MTYRSDLHIPEKPTLENIKPVLEQMEPCLRADIVDGRGQPVTAFPSMYVDERGVAVAFPDYWKLSLRFKDALDYKGNTVLTGNLVDTFVRLRG